MCQMGKGIALSLRKEFPEVWAADRQTTPGDREKLGTYTQTKIQRGDAEFVVVNAYTQFHWRGDGVLADYDAIRSAFIRIAKEFDGARIGYPLIGAGLACGDWEVISAILVEAPAGQDHTLVCYEPTRHA